MTGSHSIEWRVSKAPVPYPEAVAFMEERVAAIADATAPECIWVLEHPPLYTAGTGTRGGAQQSDLLDARFPVFRTGRGGKYTYHGPGQAVVYVMLNLRARQKSPDLRAYVRFLEDWIIAVLADFGVRGERREGRIGIWAARPDGAEAKIAALGVRIRRGVAYHGFSVNVNPDLSHFSGIVPCGLAGYGVTSLADLGVRTNNAALESSITKNLEWVLPVLS